jgi:hypothetical protein
MKKIELDIKYLEKLSKQTTNHGPFTDVLTAERDVAELALEVIKNLQNKLNMKEKSLVKECWEARKEWLRMENTSLNKNSFENRMGACGYYKFLRDKLKGIIPKDQKYEGVPLGFKIVKVN